MESYSSNPLDERTRILRLVEDGALSAEEAIRLLEGLGRGRHTETAQVPLEAAEDAAYPEAEPPAAESNGRMPRWFRIRVTDLPSGRSKVSVNIPFRLAAWGMRVGSHFAPQAGDFDLRELSAMLEAEELHGKIVDVVDEQDGEHVEIFVE